VFLLPESYTLPPRVSHDSDKFPAFLITAALFLAAANCLLQEFSVCLTKIGFFCPCLLQAIRRASAAAAASLYNPLTLETVGSSQLEASVYLVM
jgi:hypothetical protein